MTMVTETVEDLDWPAMLHSAVDGCGIRAVYQPIVELTSGAVAGYEALIRHDEAKRALVEMLGTFAHRIEARLLAEGVERPGELETLAGLRVPLAQGYHLGRPARPPGQDFVARTSTPRREVAPFHG